MSNVSVTGCRPSASASTSQRQRCLPGWHQAIVWPASNSTTVLVIRYGTPNIFIRMPNLSPTADELLGAVALALHRLVAADLGMVGGPADEREHLGGWGVDVGRRGGGEIGHGCGHGSSLVAGPRYRRSAMAQPTTDAADAMAIVDLDGPFSVRHALPGGGHTIDPTYDSRPGVVRFAARTPAGPVTVRVRADAGGAHDRGVGRRRRLDDRPGRGDRRVATTTLGASASTTNASTRSTAVTPGCATPPTGASSTASLSRVLGQRVLAVEAGRSWAALCRELGDPAPGPLGLLLPPDHERLAETPTWWFHQHGVERGRAQTLVTVARHARRLAEVVDLPLPEAYGRMRAVPRSRTLDRQRRGPHRAGRPRRHHGRRLLDQPHGLFVLHRPGPRQRRGDAAPSSSRGPASGAGSSGSSTCPATGSSGSGPASAPPGSPTSDHVASGAVQIVISRHQNGTVRHVT